MMRFIQFLKNNLEIWIDFNQKIVPTLADRVLLNGFQPLNDLEEVISLADMTTSQSHFLL